MNNTGLETIIYITIAICVILVIALAVLLGYLYWKDKGKIIKKASSNNNKQTDKKTQTKLQGIESMSKFLAFDEVVDSMIVRKGGQQYVMVVQCKGINFDLLGEEEKLAVENGFTQFLNTLRFPVQLYIQTRSLNLKQNIEQYTSKIDEVKEEIIKLDSHIKKEKANGRVDLVRRLEFDRNRKMNILEYALDITNYVSRMSQNRNVLQQNTYVAVSYYTSEFGGDIANYSKEEIDNIVFSELYTRAQTIIRGLASAGVTGRVINSEELVELLYVAYNRDDSELINISKSIEAQYDGLYNIARDVLEKQKEMIEEKIEKEAIKLTAESITRADRLLKLTQKDKQEVKRRALGYAETYKNEMTDELYNETKNQIVNAKMADEQAQKSAEDKTEIKNKQADTKVETRTKQSKPRRPLTPEEKKRLLAKKRKLEQERRSSL